MKPNVVDVRTPLTLAESIVLGRHATVLAETVLFGDAPKDGYSPTTGLSHLEWAKTVQALTLRGALQKTEAGIVVTPEGLATYLDDVGLEVKAPTGRPVPEPQVP
jgi:hypothetical protein